MEEGRAAVTTKTGATMILITACECCLHAPTMESRSP
jgi:hypothetical protein